MTRHSPLPAPSSTVAITDAGRAAARQIGAAIRDLGLDPLTVTREELLPHVARLRVAVPIMADAPEAAFILLLRMYQAVLS